MANSYLYLDSNSMLQEIISEYADSFPGIPITDRYSSEFLSHCIIRTEERLKEEGIALGMLYDAETDTFTKPPTPPAPEPPPEPEPEPGQPTWTERIKSLEAENKLLKEQISAQADQAEFYENCIAEMAAVVYA